MTKRRDKEQTLDETKAQRFARLQKEEAERRYRAYWLSLSPKERERVPIP